ncbi:DDE_3 domain-containing protein [Trichonephila clavipes]|nr:DDE_3 domain-containing protein [Trichonephila clavipes]
MTRKTPELSPLSPNFPTTTMGGRLRFDRFNVWRCERVFSATKLELKKRTFCLGASRQKSGSDEDRVEGVPRISGFRHSTVAGKKPLADRDHLRLEIIATQDRRSSNYCGFECCPINKCQWTFRAPLLTQRHTDLCLAWACQYRRWSLNEWKNVVWSDKREHCQEYLGCFFQRAVLEKSPPPLTPMTLWTALKESWCQESTEYLHKLIESMPCRLEYHGLIVQQDKAKPHTTRVPMSCLTAYQTLSWPARPPDPSPIEHIWDMIGRQLHHQGMLMTWSDNRSKLGKKYHRRPSGSVPGDIIEAGVLPWAQTHLGNANWKFQQDSVLALKATKTGARRGMISPEEWPPYTPYLNSMDYSVWYILESRACTKPHKTSDSLLKQTLVREWDRVKVNNLRPTVENFCKICIAANGGHFETN